MDTINLTGILQKDKIAVKDKLNHNIDLIERSFKLGGQKDAVLFYMSGVTDTEVIHEYIIKPLINMRVPQGGQTGNARGGETKGAANGTTFDEERQNTAAASIKTGKEKAAVSSAGKNNAFTSGKGSGAPEDKKTADASADKNIAGGAANNNAGAAQSADASEAEDSRNGSSDIITYILENVIETGEIKVESSMDIIADMLIYGDCIILIDGETSVISAACKKWEKRGITEPPTSAVLKGPREGFTEDMKMNTIQLRRILRSPDFILKQIKIGRYTNTNVAVAYMKGIADENIVNKVMERLQAIDVDGIIDSFYIEQFLEERKNSFFKQINSCEKPDIAAARMLEGRVAIIVDGSPIVLTLPYMYIEDFQSSQDYYNRKEQSIFNMGIRFLAMLIAILLPGFYVAVQVFHYNMLPIKMLITITNAVQGIPFPPMQEMLIVTLLFVIIYDASVRMPRYVGMAVSIVGALVLGDTAVKSGIISSPAVLISAISTLASQLVPEQVGLTGLTKIGLIVAGGVMGVLGLVGGMLFMLAYMSSLDSYGTPFLAPYAPRIKSDLQDAILKKDITGRTKRPMALPGQNKTRIKTKAEGEADA